MTSQGKIGRGVPALTAEEAAHYLRVCQRTLRSLRQQGIIPYVAVTPRKKLYRVEDLDAYLSNQVTVEAYQPTPRHRGSKKRLSSAGNVVSFVDRRRERQAERGC